jgi:hypothetical protein
MEASRVIHASLPAARYDAIARGKMIQAIKIYRETTGADRSRSRPARPSLG